MQKHKQINHLSGIELCITTPRGFLVKSWLIFRRWYCLFYYILSIYLIYGKHLKSTIVAVFADWIMHSLISKLHLFSKLIYSYCYNFAKWVHICFSSLMGHWVWGLITLNNRCYRYFSQFKMGKRKNDEVKEIVEIDSLFCYFISLLNKSNHIRGLMMYFQRKQQSLSTAGSFLEWRRKSWKVTLSHWDFQSNLYGKHWNSKRADQINIAAFY